MFQKRPIVMISLALCLCGTSACSESEEACDGVETNVCDGQFIITGCRAGSPHVELSRVDCREEISSETATCGMFPTPLGKVPRCYEPCTTKDEEKYECIDHASDPKSYFCAYKPGAPDCADIPSERPNSYRHSVCVQDENGILQWEVKDDSNCYEDSSLSCCLEAGKGCSTYWYQGTCDESTNTAIFCNNEGVVEHKSCQGARCDKGECLIN